MVVYLKFPKFREAPSDLLQDLISGAIG